MLKIKMSFSKILLIACTITFIASCKQPKEIQTKEMMDFICQQFSNTLATVDDPTKIPRTLGLDKELQTVGIYNWTSGFFSGNLWYLYELTEDEKWKNEAIKWTEALDTIQYWSGNHDVGFMINCSYGNGLRLSGKNGYEKTMIQTAESLIKRYDPRVKAIKSWNYRKAWDSKTEWFYPVIIDNMMNLELLFEATKLSGDKKYQDIAVQHAVTTMKNHYRDDYSSYHVIDYDTITGKVKDKATCQGFTDESSWARGQAWGLYGYVVCYRYTKDKQFLSFAENIADYILNHPNMPEDMVPYWDYHVVDNNTTPEWEYDISKYPEIPRDASAAAITSSALFELSSYSSKEQEYMKGATQILTSLSSPDYLALSGKNKYFILNHSVGSIPHNGEIDVPLVYADYYFLESLLRYKDAKSKNVALAKQN